MRTVLIVREELLARSETFITAQAESLSRFAPVFCGLRRVKRSLPLPGSQLLLAHGRFERALVRSTGWSPGLSRQIRSAAPALAHVHFAVDAATVLPLLRRLRLPMIVTLHGYDVMRSDAAHRQSRRGRLYLERRDSLFEQAEIFVCVSGAIRTRAIEQGFPAGKLRVLPIGVDVDRLTCLEELTGRPQVLFVGRLVEKKGCDVLIRAMARVQKERGDATLLVAGDGPDRARLEAQARELGVRASFLGVQTPEEVAILMRSSRCLAAPSLTAGDGDAEGLPTVLTEALALGLPVASTTHSGIPELITHGVHGLLSAEGESESLARHLLLLCGDDALCEQLRKAGRARVEGEFHLASQTAKLEQLYEEAVAASEGRPYCQLWRRREPRGRAWHARPPGCSPATVPRCSSRRSTSLRSDACSARPSTAPLQAQSRL